jgi:serralysin
MANDTDDPNAMIFDTPKGGLFGGPFDSSGLDPNVHATMMDFRWTTSFGGPQPATTISYFFPTSASDFTAVAGYPSADLISTFQPLTAEQQAAAITGFDLVASYTNLTFVQAASGLASDATFRFARFNDSGSESRFPPNNGPYSPSDSRDAGDTFLGGNANAPADFFGTDAFNTIIHEMGHAFGLKHGHDSSFNGALAPQFNNNEFSVMTYASYFGADTSGATEAWLGSSPQSYMMFDIAALQFLYGANFSKVGATAVYTWDDATGQENINGQVAPDTGVTATHKIFSTVWTEGATTTYDLSNFSGNQVDDLRPGHWLTFSHSQIADLNSQADAGTPQFQAQGNVYNALLYHGDTRSEISSIITGTGNDTIWGNDRDNTINAGAGNDTIYAGSGDDTITGGPGADTIFFGSGHSVARDTLGDMNGDTLNGLGVTNSLDILEARIDRAGFAISFAPGTTTFSANGSSFQLNGDFGTGDFMVVPRGFGADSHTQISFVNYLPPLLEAVSVNPHAINGIANPTFLTGDGSIDFTLSLKSAVSFYENTLGYYTIGADGTIENPHLLFSNTLNVPAGQQTVDLGVPGNNESIGFFLIENGFNVYGKLPDNLSFEAPGSSNPANIKEGAPPVLNSATLGALAATPVFHSTEPLNPGGAAQVLSGTSPGGQELLIGFEDLPRATADNDFNDVVVSIHPTSHGLIG